MGAAQITPLSLCFVVRFSTTTSQDMSIDATPHEEENSLSEDEISDHEISEEQEAALLEHIDFHDEMKEFLERCLDAGRRKSESEAEAYFKGNKPKRPKTNLNHLFETKR